jgi:hypothetical protein
LVRAVQSEAAQLQAPQDQIRFFLLLLQQVVELEAVQLRAAAVGQGAAALAVVY